MTSILKTSLVTVCASAAMVGGFASTASAQPVNQDGLVNVNVGDINIEDAVDVNAAVAAAITACDVVDAGPIAAGILGRAIAVDRSGRDFTVCQTPAGPVEIVNN
jgi:hypothetical protein